MATSVFTYSNLLTRYLQQNRLISEVFLQNSNQPQGTPDLTGVRVVEVGQDYVAFSQDGSFGGTIYIINLDRILLIDLANDTL